MRIPFYRSREHHALFAICSMMPECGYASPAGQPGWLPVEPAAEEVRRAHKIACSRRYRTQRAMRGATRRFRRAFPDIWRIALAHVNAIWCDDEAWLAAPLSPSEHAAIKAADGPGEPW